MLHLSNKRPTGRKLDFMKQGSKAYDTLMHVFQFLDRSAGLFADRRKLTFGYTAYMDALRTQERIQAEKAFHDLARFDYLSKQKDGIVEISKKARHWYLIERIVHEDRLLPRGEACFISYDIPESHAHVRRALRDILKRGDFKLVHHSLWMTERDVSTLFKYFIDIHAAEDMVKVIVGKELNVE